MNLAAELVLSKSTVDTDVLMVSTPRAEGSSPV